MEMLPQGWLDPAAGQQLATGIQVIISGLQRRFGQMDVETSIMSIIELIAFKRSPREGIDDAMARFEAVRSRADNHVGQLQHANCRHELALT